MHYMYVIQSIDDRDRFYIGCTSDLKRRVLEHRGGECRSTSGNDWRLVYYEAFLTLSAARKREYRLKSNRNAKRQLMRRVIDSLEGLR